MHSDETLKSLGVDPVKFAAYAKGCDSVYELKTAVGNYQVRCELRGEHVLHKAIHMGLYPMEWE